MAPEAGGISDAAESEKFGLSVRCERRGVWNGEDFEKVSLCVENRRVGVTAKVFFDGWRTFAAGDDQDIGARQRGERFAEPASGKQAATERICVVDEDDVCIARAL